VQRVSIIEWAPRAVGDVKNIALYLIMIGSPLTAARIASGISSAANSGALYARSLPEEIQLITKRRLYCYKLHKGYRIIFKRLPGRVVIIGVFHQRQNPIRISGLRGRHY
jgi:plasmid stabilization system protein ParE